MTRIVHTADWHLGASLMDCEPRDEPRALLDWLLHQFDELRPDLLVVAGDIFDVTAMAQEASKIYSAFLSRLACTSECQTLILGSDHNSLATLHALRAVLLASMSRSRFQCDAVRFESCLPLPGIHVQRRGQFTY